MSDEFDLIITGGGTAGIVAALQGARGNCKTLLVEKNGIPGGTITAGGIASSGLFYAWKKSRLSAGSAGNWFPEPLQKADTPSRNLRNCRG